MDKKTDKNIKKTTIIVCARDTLRVQRRVTMVALGNIQKYTDTDDYELILIDAGTHTYIDNKYDCIDIKKHIILEEDIGVSASMNMGVEISSSDYPYVCFMHNDVFVSEGWLGNLIKHFSEDDRSPDVIMPSQGYMTRQDVLDSYSGARKNFDSDAGMMLMSKESFEKVGKWDERFKSVFQDYIMRRRIAKANLVSIVSPNVIITHVGYVTLGGDEDRFMEDRLKEGIIIDEINKENEKSDN